MGRRTRGGCTAIGQRSWVCIRIPFEMQESCPQFGRVIGDVVQIFSKLLIGLISLAVTGCAPSGERPDALIGVAANFQATAEQLEAVFEEGTDYEIDLVTGSTGQLYAQVRNGAPFDALLAADQARPDLLEADGLVADGGRFTYAIGELSLWSADAGFGGPDGETVLRDGNFRKLAIANPELAPYGAAAMEVIEALGLAAEISPKLVRGQNVGQAFMLVKSGNAELGFVALSQAKATGDDGWTWTPAPGLYTPIRQDAVLLKRAEDNDAAMSFLGFLQSREGAAIIEAHGYRMDD